MEDVPGVLQGVHGVAKVEAVEDGELLEAWRDGDRAAGEALLSRHFAALYRFFGNKVQHGVDDLIQDTMLAMVRSRDTFRGEASFRSFLFVVARNELYRLLRTRRRRPDHAPLDDEPITDLVDSPSQIVGRNHEETLLLRALRRIPLHQQILIELHYWEQMTTAELAASMAVPTGTVKSRLRAARQRLQSAMAELECDPGLLSSTLDNLERWAASVRDAVAQDP
jgi:RNA polymerase sigma-70 factor (ECF subfamily)